MPHSDDVDIGLSRESLAAKSAHAASFKAKLKEAEEQNTAMAKKLKHENGEKEMLRLTKQIWSRKCRRLLPMRSLR